MRPEDRYDSLIQFYADVAGLSEHWLYLKAQIKAESNFDPDAVSRVGAKGLSQFMDRTWEEWKDGTPGVQGFPITKRGLLNPHDPEDVIRAQVMYMKWLLRQFDNDWEKSWAAYNWGIGRVKRITTIDWKALLPQETKDYIRRITEYSNAYIMERKWQ